ncbi:riboflavin synthase [Vibrio diabolicus]|uniref:riboflavin synthase n=1 Tax=Vibrio diabolicus TaxID=50719 RepID=UPI0015941BA4|nr:riboflavin synthase [Vibrio diabolicus]MCS0316076.1 riboflavin synthase [Vibrio diabolicus]NVC50465.1 riboflavin synthase [Vibrio diabolicus]
MKKIGIVDTAYSRVDMATVILNQFESQQRADCQPIELVRTTVPGHKELAVGALKLMEEQQCDVCIVLGWVGPKDSDHTSAHEAALAIAMAKVKVSSHILECFVFESHHDESELVEISKNRAKAHLNSALLLASDKEGYTVPSSIGDREGEPNAQVLECSQ